jgi:hypothetical protein
LFCIDTSYDDVCKKIDDLGVILTEDEKENLIMNGVGRTVTLHNNQTIIQVVKRKDIAKHHANIAHEVFHAVEFLFNRVGIIHDIEKSGEAFAYQIQHLTEQIYNKI